MSDAKQGDVPERPGMNAGNVVSEASVDAGSPRSKNRKRRWRKRNKKPGSGIQADNQTNADTAAKHSGGETRPTNGSTAPSNDDADVLGKATSGKRARRRRGRGKKRSMDTNGAVEASSEVGTRNREATSAGNENPKGSADGQGRRSQQKYSHRNRRDMPPKQGRIIAKDNGKQTSGHPGQTQGGNAKANRPHQRTRMQKADAYAALDLGTNNCRLLVAVPQQPGRFRVVDAFSRIVRLGEGLAASGRLSDEAMNRAVEALKACADKLKNRQVRGVRLIATEACRQASNGQEFLDRVEAEAGLKLELIDRETEAKLAVSGCASLVDRRSRGVVLFDIGGGSSELALLDLNKRQRYDLGPAMVSWMSLPLGVVTLSEKHGGGKLVTPIVFKGMVEEVSELLEKFEGRDALAEAAREGEIHLLGTSGTVTTLAGIHLKLPRYDRRVVDGTWMASSDIETMINELVEMSFEERVSNPCIGRDRADLVLAGCAILVAIQRMWPCPRLRVADRGLREGLLTEMMNADNAWQRHHRRRGGR